MKKMKKLIALFLVMMLGAALFAACSDDASPSGTPPSGAAPADTGPADTVPADAAPLGEIQVGRDSVVIGVSSEFSNIVPLSNNIAVANSDGIVVFALYSTLLWWDSDAGVVVPHLATEWSVCENNLEFIFKLREGVTFHNGAPLTAEDVAWTYNLLHENPGIRASQFPTFDRAEVIDTYTVKLVLSEPFAAFINSLGSYHVGILSRTHLEEVGSWEAYIENPVGSGPFQFVSRTMGSNIIMERFDDYWGGPAAIRDVTFSIISDVNAQLIALENRELDVLVDGNLQNLMRMDPDNGIVWETVESDRTCVIWMNMVSEVIAHDINLRKAIAHAIDHDGIRNALNGGFGTRAHAMGRPGITARPADGTFTPPFDYDPDAAMEYLALSNYVSGTEIRLIAQAGTINERVAEVVQGFLQAIGVNLQVLAVDGASFFGMYLSGEGYEMAVASFMPSLYDQRAIAQGFNLDTPNFGNAIYPPGVKEHLVQLGVAGDRSHILEERLEIYREIHSFINENVTNIPLFNVIGTIAFQEDMVNVIPRPSLNYRIDEWSWS